MNKKFFLTTLIIIFLTIFIIFYKSLKDTNIYTPSTKNIDEIPIFNAKLFSSSKEIKSSSIFNTENFYLLNIWSSWCLPCRKEHVHLISLKENNKIIVVGINYKDNRKNAEKFLKDLGNPYKKILIDKDGTIAIQWGAYGVPETFLIYKNKIIKKYIGPLNQKNIDEIELLIQ